MTYDGEWRSSDEILDSGKEALTFFADFIPLYDEAAQLAGRGRSRGVNYARDIQRPYDELRGIDFATFRADAEHLRAAIDSAENHQHNLDRYWGSLSGWTGQASNAGRAHHDRFNGMASGFLQGAGPAPAAITAGVRAIQDTLIRFIDNLSKLDSPKCGGMTPDEVRGAIQTAKGDIEGMESARFLSKVLDVGSGFVTFGAGWLLDYFGYGASDQVERLRQELIDAAKRSLGNFVDEFDAKKWAYDAYTRSAATGIERDYSTMLTAMRPLTVEAFRDLPDPQDFQTAPSGTTQGGDPRTQPPTVGTGTTTPSGTTQPGGATPQRPPTVPGGQPTQPSGTVPPAPQGIQVPQPGQGQQPVTIRHGNSTITVTPPDAQGRVRMTVSDGSGPPKTYDLDFSRGTTASGVTGGSGALGGTMPSGPAGGVPAPGSPGMPGVPPITPMPGINRPGSGAGSGGPTTPSPRLPSSLFPWTDKPAGPVQPDADGKFTIRDGDVTITVDPDELTDQLKITVDDGHGHQTTYNVDYKDPAKPTLRETPDLEPHRFGPTGSSGLDLPSIDTSSFGGGGAGGGGAGGGVPVGAGLGGVGGGGGGAGSQDQLAAGSFSGQAGGAPAGPGGQAAPAPAAAGGPSGRGGPMGMPMMGGMGAGGRGGEDTERGGNKYLERHDVVSEDPESKRKAVKAGGVIGEDKKQ
jgi:hypothetical protein